MQPRSGLLPQAHVTQLRAGVATKPPRPRSHGPPELSSTIQTPQLRHFTADSTRFHP